MRSGTAAGEAGAASRHRGGKTGTDPTNGWFAGFTLDLCNVLACFDDNRELQIEGAKSALPVWTEFMKRAITLKQYSNPRPFQEPSGVVTVNIDPLSGMLATPQCPKTTEAVYVSGSEPVTFCPLQRRIHHGLDAEDVPWNRNSRPAQKNNARSRADRNQCASERPPAPPAVATKIRLDAELVRLIRRAEKGIFH